MHHDLTHTPTERRPVASAEHDNADNFECSARSPGGYWCTRDDAHHGPHEASNDASIVAIWDDNRGTDTGH